MSFPSVSEVHSTDRRSSVEGYHRSPRQSAGMNSADPRRDGRVPRSHRLPYAAEGVRHPGDPETSVESGEVFSAVER